ncbi:MAG: hypothetical protein IJU47_08460 [Verrucomicrobia bacterium]|nr:hypothetical protein [Verrucomicrobiota bacterium]
MIKKYRKIGTLLLGLSCFSMGFFIPTERGMNITVQAQERLRDSIVCEMNTKELFNVVYKYLRDQDLCITFAMYPQSSDDYGLITVKARGMAQTSMQSSANYEVVRVSAVSYYNYYIDKGSSKDFSVLKIEHYFKDYNFAFDYCYYIDSNVRSYPENPRMWVAANELTKYCDDSINKEIQKRYSEISTRVKKETVTPSKNKER